MKLVLDLNFNSCYDTIIESSLFAFIPSSSTSISFLNSQALVKKDRIKLFGQSYPLQYIELYQKILSNSSNESSAVQKKVKKLKKRKKYLKSLPEDRLIPFQKIINQPKSTKLLEINKKNINSQTFWEVVELWQNEFSGPSEVPLSNFLDFVKKGIYRVFILIQSDLPKGKTVSGFAIISNYGQHIVEHLEYVAINPICRGKGLGSTLCNLVIGFLRNEANKSDLAPKFASLECESSLIPFYSKIGWSKTDIEPANYIIEKDGLIQSIDYVFMTIPIESNDEMTNRILSNKEYLTSCRNFLQSAPIKLAS